MKYMTIPAFIMIFMAFKVSAETDWMPVDRDVVQIDTYQDKVIVTFSPFFENTQGCGRPEKNLVIIRNANNEYNEMISVLLAAASSEKKVGISLSGCGGGSYDYPLAYRLRVKY